MSGLTQVGGSGGVSLLSALALDHNTDEWGTDHNFLTLPGGVNGWAATLSATMATHLQYLRFLGGHLQAHFKGTGLTTGTLTLGKLFSVSIPTALWPSFTAIQRMSVVPIGGAGNLDVYWYMLYGLEYSESATYRWAFDGGGYDRGRLDYALDRSGWSNYYSLLGVNWGQANVVSKFSYNPTRGFQHGHNADNTAVAPRYDSGYCGTLVADGHQFSGITQLTFSSGFHINNHTAGTTREFTVDIDLCRLVAPFV